MSHRLALFGALVATVITLATPSAARNRLVVFPPNAEEWPAMLYSTLDGETCLAELSSRTEDELLGCKNFGQTSLNEIKQQLASFGLGLRKLEE